MTRTLVLFAREPARQAREKGFRASEGTPLFRELARGWRGAARLAGAKLLISSPPEDRAAWARALGPNSGFAWIPQRGDSLGARLEQAARDAQEVGGRAVIVGGDVLPAGAALVEAFESLESGADAAISPASDGGVSLLAIGPDDFDLLRGIRPRRRTVLRELLREL